MNKHAFVDDKASKITRFECECGLAAEFIMKSPSRVELHCPDLECGRIYEVEYVGRVRPPRYPAPEHAAAESA